MALRSIELRVIAWIFGLFSFSSLVYAVMGMVVPDFKPVNQQRRSQANSNKKSNGEKKEYKKKYGSIASPRELMKYTKIFVEKPNKNKRRKTADDINNPTLDI